MASNKSDSGAPKTMDVMQPGKAMPPATSRPVIVSNRPMLRQDPMMVSPEGIEKPEAQPDRQTVSRVGKTLTVLAPHQSKTAKASTVMPLTVTDKTDNAAAVPVTTTEKPAAPALPQGRTPAEIASKRAIAVKTDEAAPESASSAPSQLESPSTLAGGPAAETPEPAKSLIAEEAVSKPTPTSPPAPTASQASLTDTPAPSTTEDDISTDTESGADNSRSDSADGQLAPNKTIDEAKKKVDEAEAARDAEEQQIIDSKRFYLPIANTKARRGLVRSLFVLVLVLVLAAVWLDVVLDAGIVHVGNLHALTHFFH